MKKVLIITYYWPPSGGGGVQRWVKMSKNLSEFGWEPIVFKPSNPEYPLIDHSFDSEVKNIQCISSPIWEPSRLLKKIGAEKEANLSAGFVSEGKTWKQKLAIWIRSNFFIPDARKFWIQPSAKYLINYLKQHPVDAIISSGPPHSCHLIALALKEQLKLPWIADFRDPWTKIDFYKELILTTWADKKQHELEKKVVQGADALVCIGNTMGQEFKQMGAKKIEIIPNGFDQLFPVQLNLDEKFTLTHIGTLGKARNPLLLWKVLRKMVNDKPEFANQLQVNLMGNIDQNIKQSVNEYGLNHYVSYSGTVSNQDAMRIQAKSQVLLLLINNTHNAKGILTGKFFEYLAVQRPVLAIGPPDGDAAVLLNETQAGLIADYEDETLLEQHILYYFALFKQNKLFVSAQNTSNFTRKALTKKMADLLTQIVK